ncbi:MAG: 50S ribosomal protein L29 [bacterium]|nr:50S ribosomal protein L29 [bacterium]
MNIKQLKKKSPADLAKLVATERKELRELQFSLAAGKTSKPHEIGLRRKTIARALTLIKQQA